MALSDAACLTAKGREGEYKLSDGRGLYLFVKPNGARVWQQAYRFAGKQKKLSHRPYPLIRWPMRGGCATKPKGCWPRA